MLFEYIGGILGELVEGVADLFSEADADMLAEGTDFAEKLGTAVVGIGVGAAALGALVALDVLSVDSLRKYLLHRSREIEDILNDDEKTLENVRIKERLKGAKKCSISQMEKVVTRIDKTSDGQTVATVRIIHPKSNVYTDIPIAGNKVKDIYEGLVL